MECPTIFQNFCQLGQDSSLQDCDDLQLGTTKTPLFTGVNQFFQLLKDEKSLMVTSVDQGWKLIYDSLLALDEKLKQLNVGPE
jgi:hypothetical protein